MTKRYCFILREDNQNIIPFFVKDDIGEEIVDCILKTNEVNEFAWNLTFPYRALQALKSFCSEPASLSCTYSKSLDDAELFSRMYLYEFKTCVDRYWAIAGIPKKKVKNQYYRDNENNITQNWAEFKYAIELRNHMQHAGKIVTYVNRDKEKHFCTPVTCVNAFTESERKRFTKECGLTAGVDHQIDVSEVAEKSYYALEKIYQPVVEDMLKTDNAGSKLDYMVEVVKDVLNSQQLSTESIGDIQFGYQEKYDYHIRTFNWEAILILSDHLIRTPNEQ